MKLTLENPEQVEIMSSYEILDNINRLDNISYSLNASSTTAKYVPKDACYMLLPAREMLEEEVCKRLDLKLIPIFPLYPINYIHPNQGLTKEHRVINGKTIYAIAIEHDKKENNDI